jgi:hypothetical protein
VGRREAIEEERRGEEGRERERETERKPSRALRKGLGKTSVIYDTIQYYMIMIQYNTI